MPLGLEIYSLYVGLFNLYISGQSLNLAVYGTLLQPTAISRLRNLKFGTFIDNPKVNES